MSSRLKKGAAITALAISLVGGFEGVKTKAYRDIIGVPTICFGETRGVKMGAIKTAAQCKQMLADGLVEFELNMQKCLKDPYAIPDKPYVAFLSLSWNIGVGAFCRSTAARLANAGDLRGACNAITKFNRAGGRVIQGLVGRRNAEKKLCLEGL